MTPKYTALTDELHAYLVEHGSRQDDVLRRLQAETEALGDVSVMQIAPDQGALMALLTRAIGARDALELGTFTGYSAICIVRGLAEGGRLLTCDVSEEWTGIARRYFREAGVEDRIELRIGPALETLLALPADERFDFAFVDADKEEYLDYYEEVLSRLRGGGLMMIDNVLRGGSVLDADDASPANVAVRELNERVATDERVDVAMLGVADGLTLALKR
ncbi:MAG TPA: class I SAM-dependent methyltransferase [Solirubrobacterales bacterium]|nr:class I SAM-dependent methyltransferase [Solirubrobacterales bacterium]